LNFTGQVIVYCRWDWFFDKVSLEYVEKQMSKLQVRKSLKLIQLLLNWY